MQDIYVNDTGNGFPLVLVHGFLGSSIMWEPQINYLRKNYRIISPDLPGFGNSNKAKSKNTQEAHEAIRPTKINVIKPKDNKKIGDTELRLYSLIWKRTVASQMQQAEFKLTVIQISISKNNKYRPRVVAGFSAETENLTKNAIIKIKKKHCDLIFANDVSQKDIGFNSDYNEISVIDKKGNIKILPKNKKSFIANKIVEILLDKLLIDDRNTN